jgi:transcriptional regulator with XRE-family HTH domain
MSTTATPIRFNAQLMAEDMAEKGWLAIELARRAKVSDQTVYRFLEGSTQTPPIAKKLATALGRSVRRYLIRSNNGAGAS